MQKGKNNFFIFSRNKERKSVFPCAFSQFTRGVGDYSFIPTTIKIIIFTLLIINIITFY